MPELFTIGHSTHSWEKFLELLRQHRIEAVADVRSSPYSQFNPQFNREPLQIALRQQGISYVFLGEELGREGRSRNVMSTAGGLLAHCPDAIIQTWRGSAGSGRGEDAHRHHVRGKKPAGLPSLHPGVAAVEGTGINVQHIHDDGTLESQEQAEHRLAQMFNRAERELFGAPDELVAEAYRFKRENRV